MKDHAASPERLTCTIHEDHIAQPWVFAPALLEDAAKKVHELSLLLPIWQDQLMEEREPIKEPFEDGATEEATKTPNHQANTHSTLIMGQSLQSFQVLMACRHIVDLDLEDFLDAVDRDVETEGTRLDVRAGAVWQCMAFAPLFCHEMPFLAMRIGAHAPTAARLGVPCHFKISG